MRYVLLLLSALLIATTPARANVSISIGINVPAYPTLVRVPGYPAYYDPRMDANYFFYDGLYWVYWNDHWYASSWYNGPWQFVDAYYVPVYVLCIPVRYYRHRPHYFRHWHEDHPPRWDEHWGHDWAHRRSGWDRWDRHSAPAPAPLPSYQRHYSGHRYPHESEQQRVIRAGNYRYQPREDVSRQHFQRAPQRLRSEPDRGVVRPSRVERDWPPSTRESQRESQRMPESRVEREPRVVRESRLEREPRQTSTRQQAPVRHERAQSGPVARSSRSPAGPVRERSRETAPVPQREEAPRQRSAPQQGRRGPDRSEPAPERRGQDDGARPSRDRDDRGQGRSRDSR